MVTNRAAAVAAGKPGMSADRKAAVWIGVLYIIGTVALVLSLVVMGGLLTGPAYLDQIAAQPNQVALGAVFALLAGVALALVPVVFWPVGKRYNETLAMGYVVFRGALEGVIYLVGAIGWLLLIPLSTRPDAASLAGLVRTADHVIWEQVGVIPFALGALMFSFLLYQSRLVPRWLSTWGLVGAALYLGRPKPPSDLLEVAYEPVRPVIVPGDRVVDRDDEAVGEHGGTAPAALQCRMQERDAEIGVINGPRVGAHAFPREVSHNGHEAEDGPAQDALPEIPGSDGPHVAGGPPRLRRTRSPVRADGAV